MTAPSPSSALRPPALSTHGLDKSFGSLVVAKGIAIELPEGARYALIGPNGAGKTTLINLITGMLRPDAGSIHLGSDDITALKPHQRVKRGLVRTFQINTLFPASQRARGGDAGRLRTTRRGGKFLATSACTQGRGG